MVDQGIIDLAITTCTLALGISIFSVWESGRARRLERKVWRQYIKQSTVCPTKVQDWQKYRAEHRLTPHGQ